MTLSFFNKSNNKKKKSSSQTNVVSNYPTLSSLIHKEPQPIVTPPTPTTSSKTILEPEQIDENFFYKHFLTHFHSLFCESTIICIPHSKSIQGLVITKDIIESHCFQPSPYFCGQYMATKQKHKIIALDYPIITTIMGYKEERTVHIMDEEPFFIKKKKIKLLLIDRLLEGEPPRHQYHYKHSITIPPIRNSRADLEFLNMFSENYEALHELQIAVQEFTDSYIYIKGYNRDTVEKIQHIYMKTYRTILEKNKLLQESCRTPSEHDQFLELVENVVMSFMHKKIWIQSLQSLLASQDNYINTICYSYSIVTLSQYPLRYPISEMDQSCFEEAIENFKRIDSDISNLEPYKSTLKTLAFTPLEKLSIVKSTLDLISKAVHDYVQNYGNENSDTSVTSDEMIPLFAFVIVQSRVPRIAGLIYYMEHYRLARMAEGSAFNFVITTMKSAVEFLKDDPLSLNHQVLSSSSSVISMNTDTLLSSSPHSRTRSTSFSSTHKPNPSSPHPSRFTLQHRKSQSADLVDLHSLWPEEEREDESKDRRHSAILRPHIVLPRQENRKSLDATQDWVFQRQRRPVNSSNSTPLIQAPDSPKHHPLPSIPLVSSVGDLPKLGRSLSASTVVRTPSHKIMTQPPKVITIRDRLSRLEGRPASICLDTRSLHSIEDGSEESEHLMGDFLLGLSKIDGNVVGRSRSVRGPS